MLDLQVAKSRQVLNPTSVSSIDGSSPAAIEIRGVNFHAVTEILINSVKVTTFVIESQRLIRAELPFGIPPFRVRSVEMLTSLPVGAEAAKMFFEFGRTPTSIQGIQKLVQQVIKFLLTTPGRDLFDPQIGGGFLRQLGRNIPVHQTSSIMTDLAVGISRAQTQIIEAQTGDLTIPADERLLSLDVIDAMVDAKSASIFVAIKVTSAAGESAVPTLTV